MIASDVEKRLAAAVEKVAPGAGVPLALVPPKEAKHGDFATPVAMQLAKTLKQPPPKIAEQIKAALMADPEAKKLIARADVAGGYLNLTLADDFWTARLKDVLRDGAKFGRSDAGKGTKVLLEYVSANPTGPLHIGHARNAAVADTVANLYAAAGYAVSREFYVNDVGAQMANLGRSVWFRYAEIAGRAKFPESGGLYFGEYVKEVAAAFHAKVGDRWLGAAAEPTPEAIAAARDFAMPILMAEQKATLDRYQVRFDVWFSEKKLHDEKLVDAALADLRTRGLIYESWKDESIPEEERKKRPPKDEDPSKIATWLRTSKFGDDRDRVLVKAGGDRTYLAADIAYHREKLRRGFQMLVNAWGADHHGQVPSMRAALAALGFDPKAFHVILIQMVRLMRGGEEQKMSKRSGSFVTLQELIDDVGPDAARYLMLTRSSDSPLDFDADLAKRQSNDNPVFYVQYGHARVCSVFALAADRGVKADPSKANLSLLTAPEEREIVKRLARFPDEVAFSAESFAPHRVATYLRELVAAFHSYYSKKEGGKAAYRIVSEDAALTQARLALATAIRTVLANGLALCGVSAPTKMTRLTEDADQDA